MPGRRILLAFGAVAVIAIVVVGLAQSGGSTKAPKPDRFDLAAARAQLAGAPAPLAALYAKPSALVPATKASYAQQLAALKGHPVVVNKWASWCAPCRGEFPVLQSTSAKLGKRVAFLGLDSQDNDAEASRFLKHFPLPYPSLTDRSSKIARDLGIVRFFPTTLFYNARGELKYVHDGPYTSDERFTQDIERYALGRPS